MTLWRFALGLAALVTISRGHVLVPNVQCGTPDPTDELIMVAQQAARNESLLTGAGLTPKDVINVPMYIHVVSSSKDNFTKEEAIVESIKVMNDNFAKTGFHFNLKKIDYTANASWSDDQDRMAMYTQLRKGDYGTLNIFFLDRVYASSPDDRGKRERVDGQCAFPTVIEDEDVITKDGCIVAADVLADKQTTTHEVGHWLGLYHTFHNGCEGDGDFVDDTPYCMASFSCNESAKSCLNKPGNDPVHNFMSYGSCRNEFTPGQAARAKNQYYHFRA